VLNSRPLLLALAWCSFALPSRAQLAFNFTHSGIDADALAGFQAAGARWSAAFSDPITITLSIGFGGLANGVLAQASTTSTVIDYPDFKAAITSDRTSANDFTAVASLPTGSSFSVLLNRTAGHTATPYTGSSDALLVPLANARALGLFQASGGGTDATITFGNSGITWDFDPSNGITGGAYDFVGAATHEIGHALGFLSGVDWLDQNPGLAEADTYQAPIDMFRYSTDSVALGLIDGTADTRVKYLSLNGGTTSLGELSTGTTFGDGRQAGHWKDSLGLGIMDPTATAAELLAIGSLDLVAFDVMGYNLTSIPEPADVAGWLAAGAGAAVAWRRRRGKSLRL
jgi:hypothetical protein